MSIARPSAALPEIARCRRLRYPSTPQRPDRTKPALAAAFAQRSDLVLTQISEVNSASDQISERSYSDIKDIIGAAARIQKGGGDLTSQLAGWRSYLKRFKNTAELVAEIDQTQSQPKAR